MSDNLLPPQWQQRPRRPFSVLVIEDDDNFRQLICQLLEVSGLNVFSACNGNEGLLRFREIQPSIVITDIIMPGTDGIEVIERIKQSETNVPVIAMAGTPSGESQKSFLSLALLRGADAILHKPINMDEMHRSINSLLEFHYPTQHLQQDAAEQ